MLSLFTLAMATIFVKLWALTGVRTSLWPLYDEFVYNFYIQKKSAITTTAVPQTRFDIKLCEILKDVACVIHALTSPLDIYWVYNNIWDANNLEKFQLDESFSMLTISTCMDGLLDLLRQQSVFKGFNDAVYKDLFHLMLNIILS